jgi:mono/diheme cytochrome c family protein
VAAAGSLVACAQDGEPRTDRLPGASPQRGRQVAADVGCGACHAIPGVPGAIGVVGPPLGGFGRRTAIGGHLPNKPDVLVAWIRDAPRLAPKTGMPPMPVTQDQARDVAAYLYTLR